MMVENVELPEPEREVIVDASLIGALSEGIGPRPPTSGRERAAAEMIAGELEQIGLSPKVEEFGSQRSFGPTYLVIFALSLMAWPLARSSRRSARIASGLCGLGAAAMGIAESRFRLGGPLGLLRRAKSQNVWAPAPADTAAGPKIMRSGATGSEPLQTICLVSHMDSSRSGLIFHPRVTPHLDKLTGIAGLAVLVNALAPLLARRLPGRLVVASSRLFIGTSAALLLERELRGEDVPGANDNASGVAACLNLAAHFTAEPLSNSRLVILVTGSEESGVIGMREFLRRHDTDDWVFLNFDGVSAEAPLRVLSREGGPTGWKADPELLKAAKEVGEADPELMARPLEDGSGLPYDSTPVLARGGRALSFVNQEGAIPDYHWPTDTADRVSEQAFSRAVRFGAALVRKLDAEAEPEERLPRVDRA